MPDQFEVYVDLDGVLSNLDKGMEKIYREVLGVEEKHDDNKVGTCDLYTKKVWDACGTYQENGGELWYELELMHDALELWEYVKPYNPQILSATGPEQFNAEPQKRRWVAENLGEDVIVNLTRKASEKAKYATPQSILIDDKTKAIIPWTNKGGIGILHHATHSTINYLKYLGL